MAHDLFMYEIQCRISPQDTHSKPNASVLREMKGYTLSENSQKPMGQEDEMSLVRFCFFYSLPVIYSLSKHIFWAQSHGNWYSEYDKAAFISKDPALLAPNNRTGRLILFNIFGYDNNQEP